MDSEIFIESNVIMRNPNHKFSMLIGRVYLECERRHESCQNRER